MPMLASTGHYVGKRLHLPVNRTRLMFTPRYRPDHRCTSACRQHGRRHTTVNRYRYRNRSRDHPDTKTGAPTPSPSHLDAVMQQGKRHIGEGIEATPHHRRDIEQLNLETPHGGPILHCPWPFLKGAMSFANFFPMAGSGSTSIMQQERGCNGFFLVYFRNGNGCLV